MNANNNAQRILLWGLFIITVTLLIVATVVPVPTRADDERYKFPTEEIRQEATDGSDYALMIAHTNDFTLEGIGPWLSKNRSYIMVEPNPETWRWEDTSYCFNMPNLPQLIHNYFNLINPGGWYGAPYSKENSQPNYGKQEEWKTAYHKYGYELPTPIYFGEYPITLFDVQVVTSSFMNFGNAVSVAAEINEHTPFGKFIKDLFGTDFNGALTGLSVDDIKTIQYANYDYTNQNESSSADQEIKNFKKFEPWLEAHWDEFSSNKDNISIKIDEKNLFESDIVKDNETPASIGGKTILNRIVNKAGESTGIVLTQLTDYGKTVGIQPPADSVSRYMPYDINTMSHSSKLYMHDIGDPRVNLYNQYGGTLGIFGELLAVVKHNLNLTLVMNPCKSMCETAGNINSICDFAWLSDNNIDIFFGWKGALGGIFLAFLGVIAIITIGRSVIKTFLGKEAGFKLLVKTFLTVLLIFLVIGFLSIPDKATSAVTTISSQVMSLGDNILDMDDNFSDLYVKDGSVNGKDKSLLRYWATYFNLWQLYAVNHTIEDSANKFDSSTGENPYKYGYDQSPAILRGDYRIPKWSVAMLESITNNDSNNAVRAIDHYIAPKVTPTGLTTFNVEENPYWNGIYPYTEIPLGGIFVCLSIFLLTIMKFLCFCELIIDLMLLFIRIIVGAFSGGGSKVKEDFRDLARDYIRILIYEIFITIVISVTLQVSGGALLLVGAMVLAATIGLIVWLIKTPNGQNSLLRPGLFTIIQRMLSKVKAIGGIAGAAALAGGKKIVDKKRDKNKNKAESQNPEKEQKEEAKKKQKRTENIEKLKDKAKNTPTAALNKVSSIGNNAKKRLTNISDKSQNNKSSNATNVNINVGNGKQKKLTNVRKNGNKGGD